MLAAVAGLSSGLEAQRLIDSDGSDMTFRETRYVEKVAAERVASKEKRLPIVTPRIVGGDDAEADAYPWMVGLLTRGETDRFQAQFCGAALIHPYWVLTAAHCLEGDRPENIDTLIGATDLGVNNQGERIPVVEIIMHPEFDNITFENDVALLRLATPSSAPILRLISDVALEQPDTAATVLGWGALDEDNTSFPADLQEVMVPLVSLGDANAANRYDGELTSNMIAAGNISIGGVDSCQGDSGGPLVLEDIDGEWALAGVVSFGEGCARADFPGIYTRISQFRGWALQFVMPEYYGWELSNNVFGEARDFEGDRLVNFTEFSMGQDPQQGGGAGVEVSHVQGAAFFSFTRPDAARSESSYRLLYKSDLNVTTWTELDFEETLSATEDLTTEERLTFEFPAGDQGFVRVDPEWAEYLSHATRPLPPFQTAYSALTDNLRFDSVNRPYQDFLLEEVDGSSRYVYGESDEFDIRLELYDSSNGQLLASAVGDNYNSTDELLEFTSATPVVLRVLPDFASGRGSYSVFFSDRERAPNESIGQSQTVTGQLTSESELDPLFLPNDSYYKQDYILEVPAGFSTPIVVTLTSNDFDTYLELIDIETGNLLDENDDISSLNLNSRLTVQPFDFGFVLIRVTTAFEFETGSFSLETRPE